MDVKGVSNHSTFFPAANRTFENQMNQKNLVQHEPLFTDKQGSHENLGRKIKERVEAMNEFIVPLNSSIKFTFHEELGEYYVELIDKDTQEVIMEIPPKKFLDMYAAMAEFMGLFVDKKG